MPEREVLISDLLSFRLARLANTISKSAALRFRRQFGITIGEWRTIALIGEGQRSPNEIARLSNLDKSQVSRIVRVLVDRGWVERVGKHVRGRTNPLSLTESGRKKFMQLMSIARERDAILLASLSGHDASSLLKSIDFLQQTALLLLRSENNLSQSEPSSDPLAQTFPDPE